MRLLQFMNGRKKGYLTGADLPEDFVFAAAALDDTAAEPFAHSAVDYFTVARTGISRISVSPPVEEVTKRYLIEGKISFARSKATVFELSGMSFTEPFRELLASESKIRFVYFDVRTGKGSCGFASVIPLKAPTSPHKTVLWRLAAYSEEAFRYYEEE